MATLMCLLISDKIPIETLIKIVDSIIVEGRRRGEESINIIFYGNDIKNVFRYREVFTRYIDIGMRIYMEMRETQLVKILSSCNPIYVSHEDHVIEGLSSKINNRPIVKI